MMTGATRAWPRRWPARAKGTAPMHDYHEQLDGFSPAQIWHDGCAECEARGEAVAIGALDDSRFAKAWARAAQFNMTGLPDVARAEVKLLNTLWAVQLKLERYGVEIGALPRG